MIGQRNRALAALQEQSTYSKTEANKLDWTYWDNAILTSTVSQHRLFTVPYGAGKTKAQTNWINANNLPAGQSFECFALKMFYKAAEARNTAELQMIYDVLFNTIATIRVPGKDSLGEWLLAELFGVVMAVEVIPTVAGDFIQQKSEKFAGVYPFNKSLQIGAIQTVEIELNHYVAPNAALDGDRIYVGMNGMILRLS